mmetsp:Transcript_107066/g.313098  ORF Transcript_107066/g.313098 Transcript_107066/m.313098 type:complete len:104 (-) Transcript_107066:26-337(-)
MLRASSQSAKPMPGTSTAHVTLPGCSKVRPGWAVEDVLVQSGHNSKRPRPMDPQALDEEDGIAKKPSFPAPAAGRASSAKAKSSAMWVGEPIWYDRCIGLVGT